jgi:DNA replication protein DnaC
MRLNMFLHGDHTITQEHVRHVLEAASRAREAAAASADTVANFDRLTEEQERVLQAVRRGENVFFTGVGGTGKSHTLKATLEVIATAIFQRHARHSHRAICATLTCAIELP